MTLWIRVGMLATVLALTIAAVALRAAPQGCVSGAELTPEQKARRSSLIGLARDIINAQVQAKQKGKSYQPFASLTLARPAPEGVEVKLAAEAETFSFSIVDKTGPCRSGVFSNDDGLIYLGQALQ